MSLLGDLKTEDGVHSTVKECSRGLTFKDGVYRRQGKSVNVPRSFMLNTDLKDGL